MVFEHAYVYVCMYYVCSIYKCHVCALFNLLSKPLDSHFVWTTCHEHSFDELDICIKRVNNFLWVLLRKIRNNNTWIAMTDWGL